MKQYRMFMALVLCIAMVLSLAACQTQTPEPTESTPPPTTEPPAEDIYADARAALDQAENLTLDITVLTTTTVADQEFTEQSQQTLTYAGLGTDDLLISLEETLTYDIYNTDEDDDEEEDKAISYNEIYAGGIVYATLRDDYTFSGAYSTEDCALRYLPAVLLDAELYGDIQADISGAKTTITFGAPTAPESWAVPEGAEMLEASGTVTLDGSGAISRMDYTVSYQYGPSLIKLDVTSKPRPTPKEITVPENTEDYPQLQTLDALLLTMDTIGMLSQAESYTITSTESVFSQAAALIRNQSDTIYIYGEDEDTIAQVDTSVYVMDYTYYQSDSLEQKQTYRDGKYVVTQDDGLPTTQTGVSHEDIWEYLGGAMVSNFTDPQYWQDAVCTDLGSVYLVELTYNEDLGNNLQNGICSAFFDDPSYLNNMASAYVTNEVVGYFAVDKYTGLPTASGYSYKGTHTIQGREYPLTIQSDTSIEAPSLGVYKELTDEMLPEEEPANKATPLFYRVTGENGQEMWLLGTIHVGDERTAYLPQEIYDAFNASDALAVEFNTNAFEDKLEEDERLASTISKYYYYSDGSSAEDHLDPELYEAALKYMKASGNYNMNTTSLKPSVWSNSIENFFLRQGYQLSSDKGVDNRLLTMAEEQGKKILDIESGEAQIKMSTGWSDELQELLLAESISCDPAEYWRGVEELYELWCAGDEAALIEEISTEVDTSELTEEELTEYEAQKPYLEEYNKGMSYDRNEDMLDVAVSYLESGETVFYAVGLAHLLDSQNGLVESLREAGYTVELVAYE